MPHALNLLDASFLRRRVPFDSRSAAVAVAAALAVSAASTMWLKRSAADSAAAAHAAETALASLQAQVGAPLPPPLRETPELARLRATEASQKKVLAALESGAAGAGAPYSEYLLALSRQARGSLWITGFGVAPDGHALEVSGRMTDPRRLPEYLKRLNDEPLFKGRQFAQLSVRSVDPKAPPGDALPAAAASSIEFALRAVASAGPLP